tara:strand:+ start:1042 stop:1377 length:336 start_codon:yes stop_codon:yes gene_type:complete
MASKGFHQYTVAESQNAILGQVGTAFVDSSQGTDTYTPPSNLVVIAIQVIDDITFTTNTTSETTNHASPAAAGLGTNGHDMSTLTVPSGITIYGRFNAVDISAGKAILYLG